MKIKIERYFENEIYQVEELVQSHQYKQVVESTSETVH
jgi:hypothetical protein